MKVSIKSKVRHTFVYDVQAYWGEAALFIFVLDFLCWGGTGLAWYTVRVGGLLPLSRGVLPSSTH